ncbi:MAG: SGNH/GDSL hydrolase family protein [Candidatus Krumholzibacteriota bacterium]
MKKKLMLMAGGVFFAFLIGEVAARVVLPLLPDPPDTPFVGDEACMYRLRPSEPGEFPEDHDHHINQLGFRDRNHSRTKPEGRLRVLGLGDSFVYGWVSIQDNFLRVAERRFNSGGVQADILLMGVPGWSTENQLGYLQSEGLGLDPDLVVVNFYVENDVTGIPVRGRVIRGNLFPTTSPLPVRNLLRKSQLFLMFESLVLRGIMKKVRGDDSSGPASDSAPVNDIYLRILDQNLPVYLRQPDPRTEALWAEAIGYLEEIDAACAAADVPWMVVLIPGEIQVDTAVRSQVLGQLGLPADAYDFDAPQQRLVSWGHARQVAVLDLLSTLRHEHKPDARLYVPNDTHWNIRGNQVAGLTLSRSLTDILHRKP